MLRAANRYSRHPQRDPGSFAAWSSLSVVQNEHHAAQAAEAPWVRYMPITKIQARICTQVHSWQENGHNKLLLLHYFSHLQRQYFLQAARIVLSCLGPLRQDR